MIKRYPSLYLLCFVILGIVLADRGAVSPFISLTLGAVALGLSLWIWSRHRPAGAIVVLGAVFAAFSAFQFSLRYSAAGPNHLRQVVAEPRWCRVFGKVADWPELKPGRTEIVIALDSLGSAKAADPTCRPADGSLLLKVSDTTTALQRGDRVSFVARLYPVEERGRTGFDYGRYLNLKGIFARAYLNSLLNVQIDKRSTFGYLTLVDQVRSWITKCLDQHLSPNASALARGFLIGETRDIPPDIYGMFRDSGTLHLLAVSGSNVALVLLFFVWVMRPFWFGPGARAVILLAVIALFAGLSYGDPSVMRASIMAALVLGARLLKRSYDLNNVVAATAFIILLVDPAQLFDVGFQLSFLVAWGLIFVVPRVTELFVRYHDRFWYRWLLLPFLVVLVAQVCSTPVIAYYFDRVPMISLFANLIIVPLVSMAVLGIMALLVADFIWPLLGAFVGSLVNLLLKAVVSLLALMGGENIPVWELGSWLAGTAGQVICVVAYLVGVLLVLSHRYRAARRGLVMVVLVVVNVGLARAALSYPVQYGASIECYNIPGGVAVVVRAGGRVRPDLVITGLTHRNYPLDEKVLQPLLSSRDVDTLNGLFLMSADFDALDDLIRTSNTFRTRSLYVPQDLAASLEDLRNRPGFVAVEAGLSYFGATPTGGVQPGYSLFDNRLSIYLDHSRIDIVGRLSQSSFQPLDCEVPAILVIGEKWTPAAHDWIRLHRSGYDLIVCAKLEQQESTDWPDSELDLDGAPPDYLRDISRTGFVHLELPL